MAHVGGILLYRKEDLVVVLYDCGELNVVDVETTSLEGGDTDNCDNSANWEKDFSDSCSWSLECSLLFHDEWSYKDIEFVVSLVDDDDDNDEEDDDDEEDGDNEDNECWSSSLRSIFFDLSFFIKIWDVSSLEINDFGEWLVLKIDDEVPHVEWWFWYKAG